MPSFRELELRWGAAGAYHYLTEAEKAARIPSGKMTGLDPETRLTNAIRAQDTLMAASMQTRAA